MVPVALSNEPPFKVGNPVASRLATFGVGWGNRSLKRGVHSRNRRRRSIRAASSALHFTHFSSEIVAARSVRVFGRIGQ